MRFKHYSLYALDMNRMDWIDMKKILQNIFAGSKMSSPLDKRSALEIQNHLLSHMGHVKSEVCSDASVYSMNRHLNCVGPCLSFISNEIQILLFSFSFFFSNIHLCIIFSGIRVIWCVKCRPSQFISFIYQPKHFWKRWTKWMKIKIGWQRMF